MGLIRFLLAIAVFNSHFPMFDVPMVNGHEAVLTFFAISGFYMALILDTKYDRKRHFYLSRFLSLYPMYVFALILAVALLVTKDIHPMTSRAELQMLMSEPLAFIAMIWTSICVLGQELLFSLGQATDGAIHFVDSSRTAIWRHAPLIQAWSLSLEFAFYALAPWLVRLRNAPLILLIIGSLSLKFGIMHSDWADIVFFKRFFLSEFWLFGCGIMAYRLYKLLPPKAQFKDSLFFITLIVTICSAGVAPEQAKPFALPVATVIALPLVFRLFRESGFDSLVGKVSYPFYLLHFSVIAIFEEYWDEPAGVYILVTTLVSAVLVHYVFNPGIEFWKQKVRTVKQLSPLDELSTQPSLSIPKL